MFLNENLTGKVYVNMLEEAIDQLITEEVESQRYVSGKAIIDEELLHSQQEDAPPHCARPVREWLKHRFSQR